MTPMEFRRFTRGAAAREKDAWKRTAYLLEAIVNTNRKKGRSPTRARQIFPWAFTSDDDGE